MTQCVHSRFFFKNRKARRERQLSKLANMRAAKERKRQERIAAGLNEADGQAGRPYHRFEFGVRDKHTGETAWHDLQSVRHAARALGLILKYL